MVGPLLRFWAGWHICYTVALFVSGVLDVVERVASSYECDARDGPVRWCNASLLAQDGAVFFVRCCASCDARCRYDAQNTASLTPQRRCCYMLRIVLVARRGVGALGHVSVFLLL